MTKLNFINITNKKNIIILISAVILTLILTPIINNSNKPLYKTTFGVATPKSLPVGLNFENYEILSISSGYEFDFERFLNQLTSSLLKSDKKNPCMSVDNYQNRPTIIVKGNKYDEVFIQIITQDEGSQTKCVTYIEKVLIDYEGGQKLLINKIYDLKFGAQRNNSEKSNSDAGYYDDAFKFFEGFENKKMTFSKLILEIQSGNVAKVFMQTNQRRGLHAVKAIFLNDDEFAVYAPGFTILLTELLLQDTIIEIIPAPIVNRLQVPKTTEDYIQRVLDAKKINEIKLFSILQNDTSVINQFSNTTLYPTVFIVVLALIYFLLNFKLINKSLVKRISNFLEEK